MRAIIHLLTYRFLLTIQYSAEGSLCEIHAFRLSRAVGDAPVRSTPMPRGGDTVPAGASFGSLPIVDSTAGCRCIHSASCAQPGRTNTRIAIANVRLVIISLTSDAGAGDADYPDYSIVSSFFGGDWNISPTTTLVPRESGKSVSLAALETWPGAGHS